MKLPERGGQIKHGNGRYGTFPNHRWFSDLDPFRWEMLIECWLILEFPNHRWFSHIFPYFHPFRCPFHSRICHVDTGGYRVRCRSSFTGAKPSAKRTEPNNGMVGSPQSVATYITYIYNIIYELEELLVYIYVYKFILVYIRQFITVNQVRTIYLFFASDLLIAARGVSISCGRTPPTSGWPWEAALRCCDLPQNG